MIWPRVLQSKYTKWSMQLTCNVFKCICFFFESKDTNARFLLRGNYFKTRRKMLIVLRSKFCDLLFEVTTWKVIFLRLRCKKRTRILDPLVFSHSIVRFKYCISSLWWWLWVCRNKKQQNMQNIATTHTEMSENKRNWKSLKPPNDPD